MNRQSSLECAEQIGGEIRRYGLEEWWSGELSAHERATIAERYRPLGLTLTEMPLSEGNAKRQPELHEGVFLANLATWINAPEFGCLALRVADKASSYEARHGDPWQKHFMFANLCKVYYRFRDTCEDALSKAIWACEQDIALSSELDQRHGQVVYTFLPIIALSNSQ
jgi:hypothetical protein